jgi:hypothetical protein
MNIGLMDPTIADLFGTLSINSLVGLVLGTVSISGLLGPYAAGGPSTCLGPTGQRFWPRR